MPGGAATGCMSALGAPCRGVAFPLRASDANCLACVQGWTAFVLQKQFSGVAVPLQVWLP